MLATGAGRGDALRALVACVLLAPSPPMLFMGEEWAADSPFLYFCDFEGDLAQAVTRGRRAEFARFARFADPGVRDGIPDPNAASSFSRSKLDWREREHEPHAAWFALYRDLLRLRHASLVPWLDGAQCGSSRLPAPGTLRITWPLAAGRRWHLLAQLAGHDGPPALASGLPGETVYRSHPADDALQAWSVHVAVETA
jgi:maltooligosyltrehalose trehalohydrolase